ncbi:MAG: tetratricopeptide repeat protein [Nannocystis sp.]|nr:tetratricopeptide repeat protein [Nannocystis sp.]
MTAIGGALGPATWARVDAEMGAYSRRLSTMLAGACERRRDGELSDHLYALEVECLERRAAELDALGELLAAADQEVTERAIDAVAKLPELEPCEDPARLLDRVAPPADPAVAAAVAELRRRLDRTRALRRLGSFKAAAASAEEAIVSARSIDYPLALAEALVEAGRAALELGEHERAAEHLFPEAMRLAERGGDDALRLDALGGLLAALGRSKALTEMITLLAPQARALMERRGELGSLTHGRLLNGLAETYRQRQDLDGAAAAYEEAEAILSGLGVRALAELSESLNGLATIRSKQERYAEAHALYGRARAALVAALGQHHPYIGHLLNNEARAFEKEGERATARTYFERALTILGAGLWSGPPQHRDRHGAPGAGDPGARRSGRGGGVRAAIAGDPRARPRRQTTHGGGADDPRADRRGARRARGGRALRSTRAVSGGAALRGRVTAAA